MISTDVEGFIRSPKGDYIPAERVLGGSKGNAQAVGKGVVAHPDNVMAEFALAGPCKPENFQDRVQSAVRLLRKHIHPLDIMFSPCVEFSDDWLKKAKLAEEIGCEPDWQGDCMRISITTEQLGNYRGAGGHLHFDLNSQISPDYAATVCDCTVGLAAVAYGEKQGRRRQFYGLPSLYRPKPYGLEYRTLSNWWVENSPKEFFSLIKRLAYALEKVNELVLILPQMYHEQSVEAIETENQELANKTLTKVYKHIGMIT